MIDEQTIIFYYIILHIITNLANTYKVTMYKIIVIKCINNY